MTIRERLLVDYGNQRWLYKKGCVKWALKAEWDHNKGKWGRSFLNRDKMMQETVESISKIWKQPKFPLMNEYWIEKLWCIYKAKYFLATHGKMICCHLDNMGGTWSEISQKKINLSDTTYLWNLKKSNWERESRMVVTRGPGVVGNRDVGKRIQTCIQNE